MRIAAMSVLLLLTTSTPSAAVECFDCTNFPTDITCTSTASCEGVGCYFALSNDEKFWKASCSNSISITARQTSCYKQPNSDEYCVCFGDFCNTPVEIEKAVDLRHTPFTSDPLLPWNEVTTPGPATTTHERITFTAFTIPTVKVFGALNEGATPETTTPTLPPFSVNREVKVGAANPNEVTLEPTTEAITSTDIYIHFTNHTARISNGTNDEGGDLLGSGDGSGLPEEAEVGPLEESDHAGRHLPTAHLFLLLALAHFTLTALLQCK